MGRACLFPQVLKQPNPRLLPDALRAAAEPQPVRRAAFVPARYLPLLADAGRVWTEADRQTFRFRHAAPGGLPSLAELLLRATVSRDDELVPAFRHALSLALDAGDPSLARVGESFGMGARTLQRRLAAAGVGHRELVQDLRLERAPAGACALPPEFTGSAGAHVLSPAPLR
ncbi:hypothetical protein [Sorangium sp. So ce1078]|uniref:hypothetical protein n=1 Tax=Sorangium sp. So ce1078 TaxID=3133329 RepID=UPI003F622A01